MGIGLLAYSAGAAGINTVNLDFTAATDADFSQRNSHYIFTEQYRLLALACVGASVTRGRIQVPTINAIGEFALWSANRSATVPSNPEFDNFLDVPIAIPMNEEFQVQYSNNLGAATEQEQVALLIATNDWSPALPQGRMPIVLRATATITPTVNAWSGPNAITMSASPRGGVYAVCGSIVQGTNAAFYRWVFPRYKLAYGVRKLRPGSLVQNAVGDVPGMYFRDGAFTFGEWGRFHTFELPQIEVFGITAASTTYQIFMHCIYLGESMAALSSGLGGGM